MLVHVPYGQNFLTEYINPEVHNKILDFSKLKEF